MDGERFDDLARGLAARPSRRSLLRGLGGGVAAALAAAGLGGAAEEAGAAPGLKQCKRKCKKLEKRPARKLCKERCNRKAGGAGPLSFAVNVGGRPDGAACETGRQCASGSCRRGRCRPCDTLRLCNNATRCCTADALCSPTLGTCVLRG